MDFIVASANLYGQIYGIKGSAGHDDMMKILETVRVPAFHPKSSVTIAVMDEELKESTEERKDEGEQAGSWIQCPESDFQMKP